MSQREKRLVNKLKKLSADYEREKVLEDIAEAANFAIMQANAALVQANEELDDLWDDYNKYIDYIYKNDDADISYDLLELPDGREINVMILQTNDVIAVSYNGIVGKAKRHEYDEFRFDAGYNIAATRLMMKLFEEEYDF